MATKLTPAEAFATVTSAARLIALPEFCATKSAWNLAERIARVTGAGPAALLSWNLPRQNT